MKRRIPQLGNRPSFGASRPTADDLAHWQHEQHHTRPIAKPKRWQAEKTHTPLPVKARQPRQHVLDLHGYHESEAYQAVAEYILYASAEGLRVVTIVTGWGHSRPEGGILRQQLPRWLEHFPQIRRWQPMGAAFKVWIG